MVPLRVVGVPQIYSIGKGKDFWCFWCQTSLIRSLVEINRQRLAPTHNIDNFFPFFSPLLRAVAAAGSSSVEVRISEDIGISEDIRISEDIKISEDV